MSSIPYNGVLRECQLQGIPFPTARIMMTFGQDLAVHKYPNVPGANLESLSRNPITFTVRALFIEGLKKDKTETWSNLFPQTFQNVMRLLNDPQNPRIKFVHPTLGKFNVKVVHGSTETTYECRNGQIIEFELMEDGNNDSTVQQNILGVDETAQGQQSAADLDQRLAQYAAANPSIPPSALPVNTNFTNLYGNALSPTSSTSVSVGTTFATTSAAIATIQTSRQQLFSLNDPSNAYMMIDMENMTSALNDQRVNNGTNYNVFTVRQPMTMNQILLNLLKYNSNLTIEKLIVLNPQITITPTMDTGTTIYWE